MAKKIRKGALNPAICIAAIVAVGVLADQIVALGTGGLTAYTITGRLTQEQIDRSIYPQGLELGQASVGLLGVTLIADQPVLEAVTLYDPLYIGAGGSLTKTSPGAGAKIVAYALVTTTAPGEVRVAVVG